MIFELLALSEVLQTVEKTGTEIRFEHAECAKGAAGLYHLNKEIDMLVICPDNQVNHSDLLDTVRHEAMHVVQACKGGPVLSYDFYLKNSSDATREALTKYPQDMHTQHAELEAFTAAEQLNEQQIVNLLNKFCFE